MSQSSTQRPPEVPSAKDPAIGGIFSLCGLQFESPIYFPELNPGTGPVDFHFRIAAIGNDAPPAAVFHEWRFPDGELWCQFCRIDDGIIVRFIDFVDFKVDRQGTLVIAYPTADLPDETLRHLFLNQLAPLLQSQRKHFVLHASGVVIGKWAVGFCGVSGAGKSTLALSFAGAGQPFLSDDGLRLETRDGVPIAFPSFPSLRVYDDSLAAMDADLTLSPSAHYNSKRRVLASAAVRFHDAEAPIRTLYFLRQDDAKSVKIEALNAKEALLELLAYSYILDVKDRDFLRDQFETVTTLAQHPIYFRLSYPREFDQLPVVHDAIRAHQERGDT